MITFSDKIEKEINQGQRERWGSILGRIWSTQFKNAHLKFNEIKKKLTYWSKIMNMLQVF